MGCADKHYFLSSPLPIVLFFPSQDGGGGWGGGRSPLISSNTIKKKLLSPTSQERENIIFRHVMRIGKKEQLEEFSVYTNQVSVFPGDRSSIAANNASSIKIQLGTLRTSLCKLESIWTALQVTDNRKYRQVRRKRI